MKIIIGKEELDRKRSLMNNALEGCRTCPVCGKEYFGIPLCRNVIKKQGLFKKDVHMIVRIFKCHCGAKWESEPYEEI